jgi:GR25 family glycosyltransferase involved in LPS biosynthesis
MPFPKDQGLVINLKSRLDRWCEVFKEFQNVFRLQRIDAVRHEKGWVGCVESHKKCIKIAKDKDYSTVLVLEDDCVLLNKPTFLAEWTKIKLWLDSNLDKWDIFLGAANGVLHEHILEKIDINSDGLALVKCKFGTGTHFTYYNSKIFDKILDYVPNPDCFIPIDLYFYNILNLTCIVPYNFIAGQRINFSDIENKQVDYNIVFNDTQNRIHNYFGDNNVSVYIPKVSTIVSTANALPNALPTTNATKEPVTVSIIVNGGLGNRIFQVATVYALSKKYNINYCLCPKYIEYNQHSKKDYSTNIFKKFNYSETFTHTNTIKEVDRDVLVYNEISKPSSNTLLDGYFQNEKYFRDIRNDLLELLGMDDFTKRKLLAMFPDIRDSYFIHFRGREYKHIPIHSVDLTKYYENSINYILEVNPVAKFYIFSDELDIPKKWNFITDKKVFFIENLDELESLYLMTLCKGGIGGNNNFSWWASYLNNTPNKLIILPNKWFNNNWCGDIGPSDAKLLQTSY